MDLRFAVWDVDGLAQKRLAQMENTVPPTNSGVSLSRVPMYFLSAAEELDEWVVATIETPYNAPSAAFRYQGPRILTIHNRSPSIDGTPATNTIVSTVQLPEDTQSALLMLIPETENLTEFRAIPIVTDPRHFPHGSIQFNNLSRHELRMAVNDAREVLSPRTSTAVEPPANEENIAHIRIAGWDANRDQWRVYFERYLPHPGNRRLICFITESPRSFGGFSVRFLSVPD